MQKALYDADTQNGDGYNYGLYNNYSSTMNKTRDHHGLLPQVKLKSQYNASNGGGPSRTQNYFNQSRTSRSSFSNLKQNMMDRIVSKASMHDHIKHAKGQADGQRAGSYQLEVKQRLRTNILQGQASQTQTHSRTNSVADKPKQDYKTHRSKLAPTPSVSELASLIKQYSTKASKDQEEEKRVMKSKASRIIQEVNDQLHDGSTKRYSNFINMGILQEKHNIAQVLNTAEILQELDTMDKKGIKKAYNFRLVDALEKYERSSEVCTEYRSGLNDPGRFIFAKMEKGEYRRFRKKQANKNDM